MKEIIKYGKKWSRDPDEQVTIKVEHPKQDTKIESIKIIYGDNSEKFIN